MALALISAFDLKKTYYDYKLSLIWLFLLKLQTKTKMGNQCCADYDVPRGQIEKV